MKGKTMTNEEAIQELIWLENFNYTLMPIEAIEKAIQALKQPDLILCRECEKKEVCRFYDTQGDYGYCRYGKKDGKANPQYFNTDK